MARPPKPIDPDQVEKLAGIGCTLDEMAAFVGVTAGTFQRRAKREEALRLALERGRMRSRVTVRRALYQHALAGKPAVLIFLAKHALGLKDGVALELSGPDGGPIATRVAQSEAVVKVEGLLADLTARLSGGHSAAAAARPDAVDDGSDPRHGSSEA